MLLEDKLLIFLDVKFEFVLFKNTFKHTKKTLANMGARN